MLKSAVIDASILVSAFLFPESLPGQILKLADQGLCELHFSEILCEETRLALEKPKLKKAYRYSDGEARLWVKNLRKRLFLIKKPLIDLETECRDPNDHHVIAAAVMTKSQYIITGDADLLDLRTHENIIMITARDFLDLCRR